MMAPRSTRASNIENRATAIYSILRARCFAAYHAFLYVIKRIILFPFHNFHVPSELVVNHARASGAGKGEPFSITGPSRCSLATPNMYVTPIITCMMSRVLP